MSHFHGIIVIDKPAGWTSHDVVGWTRRWLGQKKVGHAGTLDPAATGVLPVVVGDATRFVEYLSDASKSYLAEITLGVETDSADVDGVVTATCDPSQVSPERIAATLARFRGEIRQYPPMYSAVKIDGRRLYELARRGETIDVPARSVTIEQLDLIGVDGPVATVFAACSKGTYIRSLARDVGAALGVGAYLSNLVRTSTGPFTVDAAWTVGELGDHEAAEVWPLVSYRSDASLDGLEAILLGAAETASWRHGITIPSLDRASATVIRAYGTDGRFLGVGRPSDSGAGWQPAKVLHDDA